MAEWETVGKSKDGWEDVDGWETVSPKAKRTTTIGEDLGIGLGQTASTVVKGVGLLAGGAASLVDEDLRDKIFKGTEDIAKETQEYWTPKDAEQSFGGKVIGTLGTLPMQVAAMPFSPADTGMTMIQQGESVQDAQLGTLIDTLGNVGGVAMPAAWGTGMATKAVTGAGANALQDYVTKSLIQDVSKTEGSKKIFEPTLESAALSGIVGGGMGMLHAKPDTKTMEDVPSKPVEEPDTTGQTYDQSLQTRIETLSLQRDALIEQYRELNVENPSEKQINARNIIAEKLNDVKGQLDNLLRDEGTPDPAALKPQEPELTIPEKYQGKEKETIENLTKQIQANEAALAKVDEMIQQKHTSEDPNDIAGVESLIDAQIQFRNSIENKKQTLDNLAKYMVTRKAEIESLPPEKPAVEPPPTIDTPVTRYTQAIESGDVMGAIKEVATNSGNPALKVVANALLSKGFLKDVKIIIDKGLNTLGKFFYQDGSIALRSSSKNPHVFIHEILHRVTAGRLELYRQGKRFDQRTNRAIESLYKLHSFLVDKHLTSLREAMGDDVANAIGKSGDELLAHGLTDIRFQAWLNTIKYKNDTAKSAFVDKLADFFGFDRAQKTALQKLFEVGDTLIEKSKGEQVYGEQQPLLAIDPNKDLGYNSKISQVKGLLNFPNKVAQVGFTANIPIIYRGHPIIDDVAKMVRYAQKSMESLRNDIFGGSITQAHYNAKTGKAFFPLSKIETATGLLPSVKAVSNEGYAKITDVLDAFQEGMNLGRDYRDTIAANKGMWSANQLAMANNLIRMATKLLNAENNLRQMVGLRPVPRKPGYFPALRMGDHAMTIFKNGTAYHIEYFVSKAQALKAIQKAQAAGRVAKYELKDTDMDNPTLLEVLQDVDAQISAGKNANHVLENAMVGAADAAAGMTSRARARSNMPGHVGTEIGIGRVETGKRFAHGLEGFVKQYLEGIRKRQIEWSKEQYYIDNKAMVDNMPNAREIADHYADSVSGNIRGPQYMQDFSRALRDGVDTIREFLVPEKAKRDVHVLDKFTGVTGGLFYKFVLTQKFSMWVSQLATTLNASRDFYEPGTRAMDVIGGIGDALEAHTNPSRDWLNGMKYVSQSLDTFHPQLRNEINTMRLFDNLPDNAKNLMDILTGEKIMSSTDAISRFEVWNTFYHIYKRQGLSGKALWDKAADASDRNMAVYGRSFQPSMYKSMGILGENMTPLKTFAHNQTGLLVADLKRLFQSSSKKEVAQSVGSLLTTLTVMMAAGGAISIPLVAEYELLRKIAMMMGLDAGRLPSAVEWALKQNPYLSRGVISGATGIDMGASMRYHVLVEGMVEGDNLFKTLMPSIGWAGSQMYHMGALIIDNLTGDMTKEERRAMQRKILPKGYIGAGLSDVMGIRDPNDITMGTKGESLMKSSTRDTVASYLGSRTVKHANTSDVMLKSKEKDAKRSEMIQRATGFLVEGKHEKAVDLYIQAGVDPNKIDDYALALLYKQDVPAFERYIANKQGQINSFEQKRRAVQSMDYMESMQ